ncbi:hypothetical protein BSL82_01295 [Tardibacter chloracetimidivorans]|uniref:Uncharacterized protein n=1 Tax=Tardibacter chloracetimidivorans TaxID=1921510 RepID=A0A1L3ZR48_9SPHN|nr:hypothetical protein [Tardibacter chloracetimidivorans]API58099.1 hypothetical protein BSL82_01295 [Tardibacter chloracetimidivorans]
MTTKKAGFDLSSIALSDAATEIELTHPITSERLGIFVSVYGKHSSAFQDYTRRKANESLKRMAAQRRRGKDEEPPTVEQIESDAVDLLVACTAGWRGMVLDGAELAFSAEAARKLYLDKRFPFIREQVDEAVGDTQAFLKG